MLRTVKIQDKNLEIKADRKLKADKTNPQHLGSSIPGTVGKVLVKEGDAVTENMPTSHCRGHENGDNCCIQDYRYRRQDLCSAGRYRITGSSVDILPYCEIRCNVRKRN